MDVGRSAALDALEHLRGIYSDVRLYPSITTLLKRSFPCAPRGTCGGCRTFWSIGTPPCACGRRGARRFLIYETRGLSGAGTCAGIRWHAGMSKGVVHKTRKHNWQLIQIGSKL